MENRLEDQMSMPKRVSVIGAARSGIAAARYFLDINSEVFISDTCSQEKMLQIIATHGLTGATYESGGNTDRVLDCDCIILSPGVPSDVPVLCKARKLGIPVWSEMELGFRASKAPFFAVTGSTGKSTTVSLAGAVLKAAGLPHVVAGNIGLPVIGETPAVPKHGFVVAEVSSFQLENIELFHPKIAAIVNFMKNHLDRYPSEDAYYDAKKEIARNMQPDDYLILNALDEKLCAWGNQMAAKVHLVHFGADVKGVDSFWLEGTDLRFRLGGETGSVGNCAMMKLKGMHNYHNASVAAAFGKIAGISNELIMQGLCSFSGLPHRLEYVATVNGVSWYNDSKSTTAESMICAVEAFPDGVHLIAGGRDKGCDFAAVKRALSRYAKSIILIGEAADRMESIWKNCATIIRAPSLKDAIAIAAAKATDGDAVAFSPGCSSFDMFRDYEDRGAQFRSIVKSLAAEAEHHRE